MILIIRMLKNTSFRMIIIISIDPYIGILCSLTKSPVTAIITKLTIKLNQK